MVQARHIFEDTTIYIRLYLEFYNLWLNTYIVYKLYKTEIKVRIAERGLQLPHVYAEENPKSVWLHNLPSLCVPVDELNAAGTEVYV